MKWRLKLFIAAVLALPFAIPAIADINYTQGSGTVLFDFICFTTKHCSAHVPVNSAGTEIATSSNPMRVDPTGTTTQPVSVTNGIAAGTQTAPSTAPISNVQLPNGSVTGGLNNTVTSATAQASLNLKNGAAGQLVNLYSATVTTGATSGLILVLDASSDPGNVAVTPKDCVQAPANTTTKLDYGPYGLPLSTGATIVLSTNASCFTETASATALFIGGRGL